MIRKTTLTAAEQRWFEQQAEQLNRPDDQERPDQTAEENL